MSNAPCLPSTHQPTVPTLLGQRLPATKSAGLGGRDREADGNFVIAEDKLLTDGMLVEAREASDEDLLVVHTRRYLNELKVRVGGPDEVSGFLGHGHGCHIPSSLP